MSATLETNTSAWRKRAREDDKTIPLELKRPRYYYFRLESESSRASEEDTESVYSLQDRETDIVRDTSDTETESRKDSQDEYEVEIEYEVASLSGDDDQSFCNSSSDPEDIMIAAAAAAICDSSLEAWVTDCEDSDNSSLEDSSFGRTDFYTCVQCNSRNDNPLYRYCEKCFQDRKKFFPPRPRRYKRSRENKKAIEPPVKLDTLRNCLSGLSQDSGIGSSQECPPLDLDQIVVPEHLTPGTSRISSIHEEKNVKDNETKSKIKSPVSPSKSSAKTSLNLRNRKRQLSESSLSDYEIKRPRIQNKKPAQKPASVTFSSQSDFVLEKTGSSQPLPSQSSDLGSEKSSLSQSSDLGSEKISRSHSSDLGAEQKGGSLSQLSDLGSEIGSGSSVSSVDKFDVSELSSELCIFCNNAPKDSIFLHTNIAHRCCCYRCAKKTLNTIKRCPICNRPVNKVVRIYTT